MLDSPTQLLYAVFMPHPKAKRHQSMKRQIMVRIPDDLRAQVAEAAEAERRPMSQFIRLAIEERLERIIKIRASLVANK